MKIRVLIVDDEPPARQMLTRLMRSEPGIEIVGACDNGLDALRQIHQSAPDLVFLDIQMPQLDGLEVVALGQNHPRPLFVFVTAHAEHAIPAFKLQAFDYILKPFEYGRIQLTLDRVRARLAELDHAGARAPHQSPRAASERPAWDRLPVKSGGKVIFLKPAEILLIEAEGNYVRLHTAAESHLQRESLGALEATLKDRGFARVSRSAIVNLEFVKEWHPLFHGDSMLVLTTGRRVEASRTYRRALEQALHRTPPLSNRPAPAG